MDCDVIVVPYNTTATEILQLSPDGIMLSNGPGDPKDVPEAIEMIKECTWKSSFIRNLSWTSTICACLWCRYSKIEIWTSWIQSSGKRFSNRESSFYFTKSWVIQLMMNHCKNTSLEVTHIALNDGTIEGLKHKDYPAFTVQYHPEASPGPEDANYLFDQFLEMIETAKQEETAYA